VSVYTLLNQNQLAHLLEKYELPAVESITEISDGIENSNYLVKTKGPEAISDFVLTIFEQNSPEELKHILDFMSYGEERGFSLPNPLKNKADQTLCFFEHEGLQKPYILCTKLEGSHPKTITKTLCYKLGESFAGIHKLSDNKNLLANFKAQDLKNTFHEQGLTFLSEEKQEFLKTEKEYLLGFLRQCENLPHGICHCDFFPDNSLVIETGDKQQISAFLDWYDAQACFFIFDLAVIAISWCAGDGGSDKKCGLDTEKVDALKKGYESVRPLENQEHKLWKGFLRLAACQFWLSRERYVQRMKQENKPAAQNKQPDEFFTLLKKLALESS
jgi:homoserine kinase type II